MSSGYYYYYYYYYEVTLLSRPNKVGIKNVCPSVHKNLSLISMKFGM